MKRARWIGLAALVLLGSLSQPARAARPRVPLPKRPLSEVPAGARVLVKFADAARVRGAGPLRSLGGADLRTLERLLGRRALSLRPVFADPAPLERLARRARRRSGRDQPDLAGLYVLEGADTADAQALAQLDVVEFVSVRVIGTPPPLDVAPPTPSYVALQGYLGADPGVDAEAAWALGYTGQSVRISDIEYAWRLTHEEWNEGTMVPEVGQTPDLAALEGITDDNHGTAVAGVLIGGDNGYGVTGIAPQSQLATYPELTIESGARRPEAILAAAADGAPGDVILLEMQVGENITGLLGPAEIDEAVWMATRMAVDAGMVVVATAGNGALDLDREELAYYRDRGDSGAILVGAGRAGTRERLSFSTHGERVDVQGWGQDVFTTGYGGFALLGDDPDQSYTDAFAGTSSAGPIVAGVAALVQDAVKAEGGDPLSSEQMRAVLRGTGLPQPEGDTGLIGPLPQAPAAIEAALLPNDAPPSVEITQPMTTQTEADTLATSIEVDASEDTAFVQISINGELQPVIDQVPPFSFDEVVFPVGTWEVVAVATNIWEVQGSSEAVVLEVGVTPPSTSTGGEAGTTGVAETTSGDGTGDGQGSSGPPPTPVTSTSGVGSSSGGDGPAASGADGGCRIGGASTLWALAFAGLWRRRSR